MLNIIVQLEDIYVIVVIGRGSNMGRTCQYCASEVTGYRIVLSIHNIGGEALSILGQRPAGIISVYRHHPVAVCSHHYEHLPRHVRHCRTELGAWA